jgi:hypothetical protein
MARGARWLRPGAESDDREQDDSDNESSLCGVTVGSGDGRDVDVDLGTFDRMIDQTKATRIRSGVYWPITDGEEDSGPGH